MEDFEAAAEFLKAIAHPARVSILRRLEQGILCVSEMGGFLELAQPNISQHLAIMKHAGLVDCYVDGKQRCYFLKDPRVKGLLDAACMKDVKPLPDPPRPTKEMKDACKLRMAGGGQR